MSKQKDSNARIRHKSRTQGGVLYFLPFPFHKAQAFEPVLTNRFWRVSSSSCLSWFHPGQFDSMVSDQNQGRTSTIYDDTLAKRGRQPCLAESTTITTPLWGNFSINYSLGTFLGQVLRQTPGCLTVDSTTHLVPHVEYPSLAASVHGNHPSISPNSYPVNSPFYLSGYESPTAVSSYVHSNLRSLPSGDRSLPLQHLCSIFQALHTSMNRL